MCNIAGYLGNKQAAPILLEMLRRQAPYDGDMSTGVATIHEGKLYYRKIVGDIDTLIRETDVLDLPGTMGIAHTRPGGNKNEMPYHPFISHDGQTGLITNGTCPMTKHRTLWDEAMDLLDREGYRFLTEAENPKNISPKLSRNGNYIFPVESRLALMDHYLKQGDPPTAALAKVNTHMYSDNVTVVLNQNYPDRIFALRTTRPMNVILEGGEAYMATTRYGFPENLKNEPVMLPLFHACSVTRDGIEISAHRMEGEVVEEMSPYTYAEGYKRMEAFLKKKDGPFYFDDLEFAVGREMKDLWPGDHTCIQHARLVYDLLWQFDQEGRLKREMRIQETGSGPRHRWYFSL